MKIELVFVSFNFSGEGCFSTNNSVIVDHHMVALSLRVIIHLQVNASCPRERSVGALSLSWVQWDPFMCCTAVDR